VFAAGWSHAPAAFDVVHLHYPFFGTAELLATRRMVGGPRLVCSIRWMWSGCTGRRACSSGTPARAAAIHPARRRRNRRHVQRLRAASSFLAPRLGALQRQLTVIPAGVDLAEFSADGDRSTARRRVNLPDAPTVFLSRARSIAPITSRGCTSSSMPSPVCPTQYWWSAATASGAASMKPALIASLGSRALISSANVPDELLPTYYRAADAVAVPSVDRTEAFGLVLLEALACGTPIVASRLPACARSSTTAVPAISSSRATRRARRNDWALHPRKRHARRKCPGPSCALATPGHRSRRRSFTSINAFSPARREPMTRRPVLLVFGTRPELSRLAPVIAASQRVPPTLTPRVCVTGQHRERCSIRLLALFGVVPDHDLAIMPARPTDSLRTCIARVLIRLAQWLDAEHPAAMLVRRRHDDGGHWRRCRLPLPGGVPVAPRRSRSAHRSSAR
jgi:hypothetical protein